MAHFEQMLNGNRDRKYSSVFVGQTCIDCYNSATESLTGISLRKWNREACSIVANHSVETSIF